MRKWILEKEQPQLEDWVAEVDHDAPSASLSLGRFQVELLGCSDDDKEESERDNLSPHFLGHDMYWWSRMCRKMLNSSNRDPCLLDHLGIRDAVERWIADENAWEKRRTVARRKARRQDRHWMAELITAVSVR